MYSVSYKNISDQEIYGSIGIWGEHAVRVGAGTPQGGKGGEFGLQYPFPAKAGVRWRNSDGKEIEYLVDIDLSKFPQIEAEHEWYEFIFEIRQNDIRQLELVVHDRRKLDTKKRKVMLYCGEQECYFNSPFTTDEYYSPRQLEDPKLQEYLRKQKVVLEKMKKAREDNQGAKPQ